MTGIKKIARAFESFGKVLEVAFFKESAHKEAELMISDPNEKLAKHIWNLPEKKELKNLIELTLPSIAFSKQYFMPKLTKAYFSDKFAKMHAELPDFRIANPKQYLL